MDIQIDFRSHVPIYVQLVEWVRSQVASGRLKAGDQLPTVRQLAADLRVNFNTVARAYRLLDQAGLISTQQGRGTYVLEPPPAERAEGLRLAELEAMVRSFMVDAARLGFRPEEVSLSAERTIARWKSLGAPPEDGESEGSAGAHRPEKE